MATLRSHLVCLVCVGPTVKQLLDFRVHGDADGDLSTILAMCVCVCVLACGSMAKPLSGVESSTSRVGRFCTS